MLLTLGTPIASSLPAPASIAYTIVCTAGAKIIIARTASLVILPSIILPIGVPSQCLVAAESTIEVVAVLMRVDLMLLLLDEDPIQLDIAVVHDQVLLHEAFEAVAIDDIECTVLPQTPHQALHALLVRLPLLHMALHLHLSIA